MEQPLKKFPTFILKNASLKGALEFCKDELSLHDNNIFVFEQVKIDDVRYIRKQIDINDKNVQCYVLGKIGYDAQNAILKMIEEPPESRYFVFYAGGNLLDTVISRAQVIHLQGGNNDIDLKIVDDILNNRERDVLFCLNDIAKSEKEEIIDILTTVSLRLVESGAFEKGEIIGREIAAFKQFNLNPKIFLYALFVKLMRRH